MGRQSTSFPQRVTRRLLVARGPDDARILGLTRGGRLHTRFLRAMGKQVQLRVRWQGTVQGVGLRAWLSKRADANDVRGWVRNRSDGAVDALLCGSLASVERVLRAAWRGPTGALVHHVGVRFSDEPAPPDFSVRKDKTVVWADTDDHIERSMHHLRPVVRRQNVYRMPAVKNPFVAFRQVAQAKQLAFTHFGASPVNLFTVRRGRSVELFTTGMSSRVTTSLRVLINNKELTKAWIAAHGLPVARGGVVTDVDEGLAWFEQLGRDAVVKPIIGFKGRGISVGLQTDEEFRTAFAAAQAYNERVLVEETVRGVDLRIVVIDGSARAAVMRVPASVVGDGRATIKELVAQKNRQRLRNPHLALRPLRINENAVRLLATQGLSVDARPEAGRRVYLTYTANLAAGGDSVSVLERLHPEITGLAEATARSFGRDLYLGVDILLERLDVPPSCQRCAVCEINTNASPNVSLFPAFGKPFDTAAAVVDHVLARAEPDANQHEAVFDVTGPEHVQAFARWLRTKAGARARAQVEPHETGLRVTLSGSARRVERVGDLLWRWQGIGGPRLDGVRRSSRPYRPTSNGIAPDVRPPAAAAGSLERLLSATLPHPDPERDADVALMLAAFERRGVQAQPRGEGWYLLEHDGAHGLYGVVQTGLPVTRVARLRFPLLRWLADAGFRVPRHAVFATGELEDARRYHRWRAAPQRLRWAWEGPTWYRSVASDEDLVRAWGEWPESVGDADMDVEEKRKARNQAWEQWHQQVRHMSLDDEDALARAWGVWPLQVRNLVLEDEIAGASVAVAVIAGRPQALRPPAGSAHAIDDALADACERQAEAVVSALPSLDLAIVWLCVDGAASITDERAAMVVDVDCTPSLHALERTVPGAGAQLADRVVAELALSDRTFWFRGGEERT